MGGLPRWSLALLAVITLAGGALRFDAASHPDERQSDDERNYAMIARNLVANHTYGAYRQDGQHDPVHWPPGAPILFAIAHKLDPQYRGDGEWDVPGAYPWQAAVGTATIVATFALAVLLAGPVAGVLAAAAVAFYPPLITASGDLLSEPLGALLLTCALIATVLTLRRRSPLAGIAAGVLLAGTILTRADLILVPLLALAAVLIVGRRRAAPGERRPRAALKAVLPMLAALVVVVTPWTIFASSVADKFVPISSGGASNLWVGTYLPGNGSIFGAKKALEGEIKERLPQLSDRRYFQIPNVHMIRTVAARRPGLDQEAALRAEALANLREYALGQPIDYAGMLAGKVWRLWGGYTVGTDGEMNPWFRAFHLLIVIGGLAGLIGALALAPRRRPELWLLAAIFAYVTALNAVLVSEARHNLTLIPAVAVAAAAGGVLTVTRLRAGGVRASLPRPLRRLRAAPAGDVRRS